MIKSGTFCTPDNGVLSDTAHCFSRPELVAMTVLVVVSTASAFAILYVYLLVTRNALRENRRALRKHAIQAKKYFIRYPMDIYMLSLLLADMFHSLGGLLNAKWIGDGFSDVGMFCTFQGIMNQIGPLAIALNTILITIVTFVVVWWRRGAPRDPGSTYHLRIAFGVTLILWFIVAALVAIPAIIYHKAADPYWAPTPFWCTISKSYELERLLVKYLFLWIAFVISVIFCTPLALWARGNITPDDDRWWRFRVHRRIRNEHDDHTRRLFFGMIAYPLTHAILIIPLSIVRWLQNTKPGLINPLDNVAVVIVFNLSGLANVWLLLNIRPNLLLLGETQVIDETSEGNARTQEIELDDASN